MAFLINITKNSRIRNRTIFTRFLFLNANAHYLAHLPSTSRLVLTCYNNLAATFNSNNYPWKIEKNYERYFELNSVWSLQSNPNSFFSKVQNTIIYKIEFIFKLYARNDYFD